MYEQLLVRLQAQESEGRGIREFVRILKLHAHYPAASVQTAVERALTWGCIHADGVELCLRQHLQPQTPPALDLSHHPQLVALTTQNAAPDLHCYEQLLSGR